MLPCSFLLHFPKPSDTLGLTVISLLTSTSVHPYPDRFRIFRFFRVLGFQDFSLYFPFSPVHLPVRLPSGPQSYHRLRSEPRRRDATGPRGAGDRSPLPRSIQRAGHPRGQEFARGARLLQRGERVSAAPRKGCFLAVTSTLALQSDYEQDNDADVGSLP